MPYVFPTTDKMVEAALSAIEDKRIDARRFWTDEDHANMRTAIEAALRQMVADNTQMNIELRQG